MTSLQHFDERARRKADLRAASTLLRVHAAGAVDELCDLADALSHRVDQLRSLAASPTVRIAGLAFIAVWVARRSTRRDSAQPIRPRRGQSLVPRLWPWATMAWRLGGPALMRWLAAGAAPRR